MSLLSSIKKLSTLGTDTSFKVPAVDDTEHSRASVHRVCDSEWKLYKLKPYQIPTPNMELSKLFFFFPLHVYVVPGKSTTTSV